MSRPFDFSRSIILQARLRQMGFCGHCNKKLDDLIEHAHHVIPNQVGKVNDPRYEWLKKIENCVVLCDQCHDRVHQDGRFRTGAVAPPEYFPYSHYNDRASHQKWVARMNQLLSQVWS